MEDMTLAQRMKGYEDIYKTYLKFGTPKIIRVDMRSGKKFTETLVKPFDQLFSDCMVGTMKYLCKNIPGAKLGYTQSDEITIIIKDINKDNQTVDFFNNSLTKIISNVASMTTLEFNRLWSEEINIFLKSHNISQEDALLNPRYSTVVPYIKNQMLATFDCRYFSLPNLVEVSNNLIWRQQDCYRNSLNNLAYRYFNPKELEGKNLNERAKMLKDCNVNINNYPNKYFKGIVCYRIPSIKNGTKRIVWQDNVAPSFLNNLSFIENCYNEKGMFDLDI